MVGFFKTLCCALVLALVCLMSHVIASPLPSPDSAGIVELPPGLAYGGIPYGSVTGMVADYYGGRQRSASHPEQPLRPVYY